MMDKRNNEMNPRMADDIQDICGEEVRKIAEVSRREPDLPQSSLSQGRLEKPGPPILKQDRKKGSQQRLCEDLSER